MRDAEVHQFRRGLAAAALGQEDVVGLDVPVDDAPAVGVVQGVGDSGGDRDRFWGRKR